MKKLFRLGALLGIAAITFSSCKKDDDFNFHLPINKQIEAYVTSNTAGKLAILSMDDLYDLLTGKDATFEMKSLAPGSTDTEGVHYNKERNELIIASRGNNRVEVYQKLVNGTLELKTTSERNFTNARDVTMIGNMIIVAQQGSAANNNMNMLYAYERTPSGVRLQKTYSVDFNLWGIHGEGMDLWAVVDNTSDIVMFKDFLTNPSGMVMPTKRVTVEGIVRTHGLVYSKHDDKMILTDVAAATSDSDGAISVINNFTSVWSSVANGGTIGAGSQIRIAGPNTMLGNPVQVSYDMKKKHIYVAERANGGGRLLVFEMPTSNGDPKPAVSKNVPGASDVYVEVR
ncbi:hypothetical protein [Pontibacter sp. SGAir0037]|uniref:hypothetical protein n=1 Tax=Pontibacter sp. SGAir0037 TaxID=2571030 RepID=UPI0010CD01FA|nr:hypothetical protein [Pontibacter sp. SGAir0037]QCR24532.1 hypothetical protein C1N53_20675 [Pontibacter sp. SGAir0037]